MTGPDRGYQPYVGLRAFRSEDHDLFFGRANESADIGRIWRSNKLTVLYGASGVGKTSLLQAGVVPAINPARFDVLPLGRIRQNLDFPPRVSDGNPFSSALLSSWAPNEPATAFDRVTITEFLRQRGERKDAYGDPVPLLAAIDQAEELFSALPLRKDFLKDFIDDLARALRDHEGLRLLLSLREDYLAAVLPYEYVLERHSRMRTRLMPFSPAAALEAVRGPLHGVGVAFEPGAAEQIVTDLRRVEVTNDLGGKNVVIVDTVEPASVQVVCSELWNSIPDGTKVIRTSQVREFADIDRALTTYCGRVLGEVGRRYGVAALRIRVWLQQKFVTEHGTRGTAYEGISKTAGMPNEIVHALEDLRILRADFRSGTRWYELQHDGLINPIRQVDPAEHLNAAKLARDAGDWELARSYANHAMRIFGSEELRLRADAERLLGDVSAHTGELREALDRYRKAAGFFEVLQDSVAVGELLAAAGRLSLAQGRYGEAVTDLQAAIARTPRDLAAQTDLAWAIWHSGQPRAALAMLDGVLSAQGNLAAALTARGELLADSGDAERALTDLDRVDRDQLSPAGQAARALALARTGQVTAAVEVAARAQGGLGNHGPGLLRLAVVAALAGHEAEARRRSEASVKATAPTLPPHLRDYAEDFIAAPDQAASARERPLIA